MSMILDIILIATAGASLAVAGVMVWYVRKLLMKMTILTDLQKETLDEIQEFSEHLEVVSGLETFYGDETLTGLLKHTRSLADSLVDKVSSISFIDEYVGGDDEEEEYGEQ